MAKIYYEIKNFKKSLTFYELAFESYSLNVGGSHLNSIRTGINIIYLSL